MDADSAENHPDTPHAVIYPVSCEVPERIAGSPKLSGKVKLRVRAGTLLDRVMGCESGSESAREEMFCNYEVNPEYIGLLESGGLVFNAYGLQGEIRGAELPEHPFFLATLFQPQLSSTAERPHPLIMDLLRTAAEIRRGRWK